MKLRALFAVIAVAGLACVAAPARAGLDFVETVVAGSGSNAAVRYNTFDAATFGTLALAPGFETGADRLTVTVPTAVPFVSYNAVLEYRYTTAFDGTSGMFYSYANGDGRYDLVVQLGTITIDNQGSLVLTEIDFSESLNGAFSSTYGYNRVLTAQNSNAILYIDIPEAIIPVSERDVVDIVRLKFSLVGSGTSLGINAVANPEPGTVALFGLGLAGLAGLVRRRRRAAAAAQ